MNREDYLKELYARLARRMGARDLDNVMRYYEEYFDEQGPSREQAVMTELGPPERLARQVLGDRAANTPQDYYYDAAPVARRWTAGKVIALLCLSPIWLPVLAGLFAAAVGLVAGIGGGGICAAGGGVFSIWGGFTALFTPGFTTTMVFGGAGLLAIGIGFAMLAAAAALAKVLFKGLAALCRWIFIGGRAKI